MPELSSKKGVRIFIWKKVRQTFMAEGKTNGTAWGMLRQRHSSNCPKGKS